MRAEADGSFVANAAASIRALNRSMRWNLPTDGPKTLNGLILESVSYTHLDVYKRQVSAMFSSVSRPRPDRDLMAEESRSVRVSNMVRIV